MKASQLPTARLLVVGPPKHGKTFFLRSLAKACGSWSKATLTVKGSTESLRFSLRESNQPEKTLEILAKSNHLLDGLVLICNITEDLPRDISSIASFGARIGVPLRAALLTHCDLFSNEADIDEYELLLRERLEESGDQAPMIRVRLDSIQKSIGSLLAALSTAHWGVPLHERPLRMLVEKGAKQLQARFDFSGVEACLQQGKAQVGDTVEAFSFTKLRGLSTPESSTRVIEQCFTEEGPCEKVFAPARVGLVLQRPMIEGSWIFAPQTVQPRYKARVLLYCSDLWLPNPTEIAWLTLHWNLPEPIKVRITPKLPKSILEPWEHCEAQLELIDPGWSLPIPLAKGMGFFWKIGLKKGGGVMLGVG